MPQTPDIWRPPPEKLNLPNGEVHVWRALLEQPQGLLTSWWNTLAKDERERAGRFHFDRDRHQYIAGRGILREILGQYLNEKPGSLRFSYTYYGKPSLKGDPAEICFNLSHAAGVGLFAFGIRREVGVDIEKILPDIEYRQIASRFSSKNESAALLALPENQQRQAFFLCWTRKEAYIKGIGEGLSLPLHSFDVSLAPGRPAVLIAVRGDEQEAGRWNLKALQPGPDFEAALVAEGTDWQLKCWQWR